MIAVSLMPRSTADALARLKSVLNSFSSVQSGIRNPKSEISVELRLDSMRECGLERLLAAAPCPVIATFRPRREGGLYGGPEEPRLETLRRAARLGAAYIDIEQDAMEALGDVRPAKRIVSYHNFRETPADLADLHARLAGLGADVVKIAVTARHILDCAAVLRLLRDARTPTIALAMGERGVLTRLLAPKFGSFLTYASFGDGSPEAGPGQIPLDEMLRLYRVHRIGRATRVYGVIADPVAHSLSPAIHNAAFAALDLDAVYVPLWVEGDAAAFVHAMREFEFDGYSVTIPHKQKVMEAMDDLAPLARRVGAMNTVVRRPDGSLFGTNTDISAAVASIEAVVGRGWLRGKRTLLLGAGGLGRAIAFALADSGAHLTITDVDLPRAEALTREVGAVAVRSAFRVPHSELLLNCTPVGMHPDVNASPVPAEMLRKEMVVYDAVYNPAETKLLRDARAAGCRTVAGLDHFVRQAVEQFELWTGQPAPVDTMRRVVLEALGRNT